MSGNKTFLKHPVKRMLHTGKTLGGVVVFVVNMEIIAFYGFASFLREEIVVDKRLCCLAGKLHHHSCRRICIHIGIFACDVVRLGFDDFQKDVTRFGSTSDAPLIAVGDVAFSHFFARAFHQFQFHIVLDFLDSHTLFAGGANAVGNLLYQRFIFALFCL